MKRVLIISDDAVGSKMAGPAIRDWEYARVLSRHCRVVLAAPNEGELRPNDFVLRCHAYDAVRLQALIEQSDVIVTSGYLLRHFPFLATLPQPLVITLSHSFVLENMQRFAGHDRAARWAVFDDSAQAINQLLRAGDFFICNSERQRDYWLGMLSALGRVNPDTVGDDPSLRRLIDIVPFGLPETPPRHERPVLKGVWPGIGADDRVLFWGGGIYDWLDPLAMIRAMRQIVEKRPDAKLFFAGVQHPNPAVPASDKVQAAIALSCELGLLDRHIVFNEWIPYEERGAYLLEADVGVSLHLDHVETRYAFRTRFLDCVWASLPLITTIGDVAADVVQTFDLGRVVDYGDVDGVSVAVLELLALPDLRAHYAPNFAPLIERYRWPNALAPLVAFCRDPYKAADHINPALVQPLSSRSTWRARWAKGRQRLREGGLLALWTEVISFVRWWLSTKQK